MECLDAEQRAFADLSLMDSSDWSCPTCVSRIERLCGVCFRKEFVVRNAALDDWRTGWLRCGNALCGQWYHVDCVGIEGFTVRQTTPDSSWWCQVCCEE